MSSLSITAGLWYTSLLASEFASSTKDPKRIAQILRETSIRDLSLRLKAVLILLHTWYRGCTEQGSNLPKVKCWTVGRPRHKPRNTRPPGLTGITGSPFFAFRACWMPCTDWDKLLPMDWSIDRHLAETAHRPGAISYLLAYLLRSLLMDTELGRINQ